jgi:RecA/RadA recombinase
LLFLITAVPDTSHPVPNQVIHSALAHYASIRLLVYRIRWLYGRRDIRGYEAKITIAKNKLAASAAPVNLTITLAGTEGDS